jgi:membrane protein implicated in regulation of membrane protease activity
MDGPDGTRRDRQPYTAGTIVPVAILLLAPIVALLWVGSYTKATPKLWGFPFFYWYQFLWVFLAAGCTYSAYLLLHRGRGDR